MSVTAADVDGDGAVDLVTANSYSNTVSVLRNLGDGTFAAQVTYAVGDCPCSVTAADVDGDGAVDLVTANSYSDTVSRAAEPGRRHVRGPGHLRGGEQPLFRDGGGRGRGWGGGPGHGELLLQHRFGAAEPGRRHVRGPGHLRGGERPRSVAAADVDGDGAVDLVTANSDSNTVSVLRNLGDGTFAAQVDLRGGSCPDSVTAADVDGDGAVGPGHGELYSNTVSVLLEPGRRHVRGPGHLRGRERAPSP